jgi:hypothetical protein
MGRREPGAWFAIVSVQLRFTVLHEGTPRVAWQQEAAMTRLFNRSLFFATTAMMVALPVGWAVGEEPASRGFAPTMPMPRGIAMPCGKRTDVIRMLRQSFGEGPIGQGLANSGAVAEVFISPNGTWTIVVTSPNGMSCMIGAGQSWQPVIAHDDTI